MMTNQFKDDKLVWGPAATQRALVQMFGTGSIGRAQPPAVRLVSVRGGVIYIRLDQIERIGPVDLGPFVEKESPNECCVYHGNGKELIVSGSVDDVAITCGWATPRQGDKP